MTTTHQCLGDIVLCDMCNADYTNSDAEGGFIFAGKAVCPICAPSMMHSIVQEREEASIQCLPYDGEAFAAMVRSWRGGPAYISITPFDTLDDIMGYLEGDKE